MTTRRLADQQDWVKLSLPSSQEAEFSAQSFSGDIHTDFGKSVRVSKGPGVVLEHREGDNGAKIRVRNRCALTGRPRGHFRKFKLCRNMLRLLAQKGDLPGIVKSSW